MKFINPIIPLAAAFISAGCAVQNPDPGATHVAAIDSQLEMARKTSLGTEERAAHYLAAAAGASHLLDSGTGREAARRSYNSATTELTTLLRSSSGGQLWNRPLTLSSGDSTYHLRFAHGNRSGVWDPDYFTSLTAADQMDLKNLRPNGLDGVGGTLIGVRKMNPQETQAPPSGISAPVTAVLNFKGNDATLALVDPTEKTHDIVAGADRPLDADFSAPLAYYPHTSEIFNGLMGALRVEDHLGKTGLYMLQPYDPDRIPLVFVHGLISTPQMWRGVINEINRDPLLRKRYQCWVFAYPTGNPPAYSALRLREELATARQLHPGMKDFVLVGHSMGGIISRMQATTFDRKVWEEALGRKKADVFFANVKKGSLIERSCLFQANPHVARLVFICTPHRGSEMALGGIGSIARRLITLPATLSSTATATLVDTLSVLSGQPGRLPNSVTGLSPTNPTLNALDRRPIEAPYHSIIGDRGKGDSPLSSDGVVKYWSSHLSSSQSECIVPGPHGACDLPETIHELKRILRDHCGSPPVGHRK